MSVLLDVQMVRVEFGTLVAVRDVSFALSAGDLMGLIGPNGAGKTTLMRAIGGLMAPTCGRSYVMGHDVINNTNHVRRQVAFAPDSPPAYEDLTVDDFLLFIARSYGLSWETAAERMDYWLEQLWLTDKRQQKIGSLSRGMKQRVTIARTLIPNPNVILLDEPSSGLDPAGRIQLRQVIASLRDQGKAVIVSSHILADLEEYCTHIAIIEHGSLLRFGSVQSLSGRQANRHRLRMVLHDGSGDWGERLLLVPSVSDVVHKGDTYVFEYDDGKAAAAMLLRQLVNDNWPIAEFAPLPESLEETYLKAGVKQVD
jgi:ABC-2 type transport system ATP-binding protein